LGFTDDAPDLVAVEDEELGSPKMVSPLADGIPDTVALEGHKDLYRSVEAEVSWHGDFRALA
jgi:hypothetical protein